MAALQNAVSAGVWQDLRGWLPADYAELLNPSG
jgi:hypothetical protein